MPEHLRHFIFLALAIVGLAGSSSAQNVDTDDPESYSFQFDEIEGTPLDEFIKLGEQLTKIQMTFEPADTKEVKLRFLGKKRIDRKEFFSYFQAVLKSKDFVLVQYGNVRIPGRQETQGGPDNGYLAIRRSTGGIGGATKPGYIRSQAPVIGPDQLDEYRYDPGIVVTTSFLMRYVNAQEMVNMLQTYFSDPMIESVRAVAQSNALVATGYAQSLWGVKQLITLIDVEPTEFKPEFAKIDLEHAVAEELKAIVEQLIAADRGTATPGGGRAGVPANTALPANLQEPEPHVEADPRTNSLLVVAAEKSLIKITNFIRLLDVDVDPRGDTHVYRLKNSAAKDLEEILRDWADSVSQGSSGTGSGGAGGAGGAGLEQPIVVVADEASNSLIISASKSRYAQVLEIVKRLDVRRRQVLIESALVEINGNLNQALGVELGYISSSNSSGEQSFGVTNFGLSEKVDTNTDGIADFRIPLGLGADAAGAANAVSGITTGIFNSKNFSVPIIINALRTTSDANILSMPSVLVNDNEEAVIRTLDEQPTFTVSQGVNSDQTSFQDFVEAGIQLNISPSISAGNYLRLFVKMEVSTFATSNLSPPPRFTRELDTSVTLPDGHTMVIGGIVSDEQRKASNKVPWLGELPLFGWLFGTDIDQDIRANLYVFITPHIISDDFANLDDLSYLKKKEMEALNGKIHLIDEDWDRDNADTRILDAGVSGVFDMPSYRSPPGGELKDASGKKNAAKAGYQYGDLDHTYRDQDKH